MGHYFYMHDGIWFGSGGVYGDMAKWGDIMNVLHRARLTRNMTIEKSDLLPGEKI